MPLYPAHTQLSVGALRLFYNGFQIKTHFEETQVKFKK